MKLFAFTLDLETDYSGCIDDHAVFNDLKKIEEVLSLLNSLDVKITVFAVGNVLERFPEVIQLFEKYNCEFEAHSYSHDFRQADSEEEILKAREAYFNYFKEYPLGYRAPRGDISDSGINLLEKYGFSYDSSVTPSFFPNPFRYLFCRKDIHYIDGTNVLEIPLTPVSPLRLTSSISYIKILGIDLYMKLLNLAGLPDVICFNSHLHDFIIKEDSLNKLFPLWRFLYGLNKHKGMDFCKRYIEFIRDKGYKFCYMSEIYDLHKK